ncbi:hypothetical protein ASZ90_015428 [hydrocarbon metagenome]|uniref:Uncharacterized protein n=1 Tax=hydrocarbon metagenome TaxID=938273 RepID=A0A0W8F2W4_9ZZZZ
MKIPGSPACRTRFRASDPARRDHEGNPYVACSRMRWDKRCQKIRYYP